MNVRWLQLTLPALALVLVIAERATAHFDILLARPAVGTKTVIGGADVGDLEYDDVTRVFEFELGAIGGEWLSVEPGVNHPSIDNPALAEYPSSAAGLQPGDVLRLKERSFSVGGQASDLFYWSGLGPISFAPAAAGFRIDEGDPLDGAAGVGGVFDEHPFFVIDDNSLPGIYLASVYGVVDGFEPSDPVYLVMGMTALITADFLGITHEEFDLLSGDDIDEALEEVLEHAAEYVYDTLVIPEPASLLLAAIASCAIPAVFGRRRGLLARL